MSYRAKRVDNRKWVYGWYAKRFLLADDGEPSDVIYDVDSIFPFEVIPESVGQSTGREDTFSKMIYGDDLLCDVEPDLQYIVGFGITEFGTGWYIKAVRNGKIYRFDKSISKMKIIGNAADKLLKE